MAAIGVRAPLPLPRYPRQWIHLEEVGEPSSLSILSCPLVCPSAIFQREGRTVSLNSPTKRTILLVHRRTNMLLQILEPDADMEAGRNRHGFTLDTGHWKRFALSGMVEEERQIRERQTRNEKRETRNEKRETNTHLLTEFLALCTLPKLLDQRSLSMILDSELILNILELFIW
jgi:hypothetical protein